MNLKKIISLMALSLIPTLCLMGCGGNDGGGGDNGGGDNPTVVNSLSGSQINDSNYILWQGRHEYKESDQKNYFYYLASGFSVTFTGTKLEASFKCNNYNSATLKPTLTVLVDSEVVPSNTVTVNGVKVAQTEKVIQLTKETSLITLASELSSGTHTVTVLKQSQPRDNYIALSSLGTDGEFKTPQKATTELKIQIVGGSGISGHGALGYYSNSSGPDYTTLNSSPFYGFGYLTARMFNAEYEFVTNSGWGLKMSKHTSGNNNIMNAYEKVGIDTNSKLVATNVNHENWHPDVVICNVGGNDYTYINTLSGTAKTEAENAFKQAVETFVERVKEVHPNTQILWTFTSNKDTGALSKNGAVAKEVLDRIDPSHSYTNCVIIPQVGDNGTYGADNHNSVKTHAETAQIMADKITQILGVQPVRNNIVITKK